MRILVPFEATRPKTRLDGVLDADEREAFSRAMLRDVLDACLDAGHDPEVVATAPIADVSVPTTLDDRALSDAVNARLAATNEPLAVVVADLALLTPSAVDRLVDAAAAAALAIAPGRGGGTNGLVVSHPDFRVDFHGVSYCDHRDAADALGIDVRVVDSMRLSTDVDEPVDLVEVLLHGEGEAAAWLRAAGFELDVDGGRVGIDRRE
jgi:2-phospho-L-lactate guanylyltransferase